MAQKAAKTLATRNRGILNRAHLISLVVNLVYLLLRFLFLSSRSLIVYIIFSLHALAIEFYLERLGRPTYNSDGSLHRAGEDLEAKGLTEYMWDVLYWTWGCIGVVSVFGDKAWWLWAAVPLYSAWLAWTTFTGVKEGFAGMQGGGDGPIEGGSKRQKKMEKRGGQKVQYR